MRMLLNFFARRYNPTRLPFSRRRPYTRTGYISGFQRFSCCGP